MKLDIAELMNQKNSLANVRTEMASLATNINNELDNVCANVQSATLVNSLAQLRDSISSVNQSLDNEIVRLTEFMGSQLSKYQVTNEEATEALRELVNTLNNAFAPDAAAQSPSETFVSAGTYEAGMAAGGAIAGAVASQGGTSTDTPSQQPSTQEDETTSVPAQGQRTSQATGTGNFTKYNLTETQIRRIAALAVHEQGTAKGAAAEASLMANRFEMYGSKYSNIEDYVEHCKWFAHATKNMNDTGIVSQEAYEAVRKVLVEGKRTLPKYVDEHDCISDIKSISTGNKKDRSSYVPHQTVIKNNYKSTYTFYSFPDTRSDPYGYTSEAKRQQYGDECYSYEQI